MKAAVLLFLTGFRTMGGPGKDIQQGGTALEKAVNK